MKAARMISDNYMFTANFIGVLLLIGFGVYCYIAVSYTHLNALDESVGFSFNRMPEVHRSIQKLSLIHI